MKKSIHRFRSEKGTTAIEYACQVSMLAVALIVGVGDMSANLGVGLEEASYAMQETAGVKHASSPGGQSQNATEQGYSEPEINAHAGGSEEQITEVAQAGGQQGMVGEDGDNGPYVPDEESLEVQNEITVY